MRSRATSTGWRTRRNDSPTRCHASKAAGNAGLRPNPPKPPFKHEAFENPFLQKRIPKACLWRSLRQSLNLDSLLCLARPLVNAPGANLRSNSMNSRASLTAQVKFAIHASKASLPLQERTVCRLCSLATPADPACRHGDGGSRRNEERRGDAPLPCPWPGRHRLSASSARSSLRGPRPRRQPSSSSRMGQCAWDRRRRCDRHGRQG